MQIQSVPSVFSAIEAAANAAILDQSMSVLIWVGVVSEISQAVCPLPMQKEEYCED
jgi:hypothetical protein